MRGDRGEPRNMRSQVSGLPLPCKYRGMSAGSAGWCLPWQCRLGRRAVCPPCSSPQGVPHCPAKPCSAPAGRPAGGRLVQPPAGGRYIILDRSNHWSDYILLVITVVLIHVTRSPMLSWMRSSQAVLSLLPYSFLEQIISCELYSRAMEYSVNYSGTSEKKTSAAVADDCDKRCAVWQRVRWVRIRGLVMRGSVRALGNHGRASSFCRLE